jgi:hypothetical protein
VHDSSTCPVCGDQPVNGSMSDEQFAAFLDACRQELADKQSRFQKRIARAKRWHYDLDDGSMTIGKTRYRITAVGTHSAAYQTWLWSWAKEENPPQAREKSRQLQRLHDLTGFRVFLNEGITASSADAQDFAAMAVHQLGAIGLFRCPAEGDGPTLYLAVHEPE